MWLQIYVCGQFADSVGTLSINPVLQHGGMACLQIIWARAAPSLRAGMFMFAVYYK